MQEPRISGDILNSTQVHSGRKRICWIANNATVPDGDYASWTTHRLQLITGKRRFVLPTSCGTVGYSSTKRLCSYPRNPVCSFRLQYVRAKKSGAMLWTTFDIPTMAVQTGHIVAVSNSVWQPPAIDPKRGTLFVGTGNNYTSTRGCDLSQMQRPQRTAIALTNFFDTGACVGFSRTVQVDGQKKTAAGDLYTLDIGMPYARIPKANCPVTTARFRYWRLRTYLLAICWLWPDKSGTSLGHSDPDNGNTYWSTRGAKASASLGGIEWARERCQRI